MRRRAKPPSATVVAGWPAPTGPARIGAATLYRTRPPGDDDDRYEPVARQPAP
jgi:hypothetical protein